MFQTSPCYNFCERALSMGTTIQQILITLTTYPGNLIYHMALAFSIAGALQAALSFWQDSQFPQGRRMVIGLLALLGIRFVLFISAGLTQQGLANPHILLPILDRAATQLSLVIILWLWVFPEPVRVADAASGLLALITISASVFSFVWWADHYSTSTFNILWLDVGWELYALALIMLGIIFLIIRRPNGWAYGLSMLLISALGHILHLSAPLTDSDFPEFVRLAQMAAYPLLFTLPRRFAPPAKESSPTKTVSTPIAAPIIYSSTFQERPLYGIEPARFESILAMLGESSLLKFSQALTRTVAEAMLADICLLIYPPDGAGQLTIPCGYDLIRQEILSSMALDENKLPMLAAAMKKSRALRLPASSTSQDLTNLGGKLGLGTTGHLLAGFVPTPEGETSMGLILLSPHSDRRWSRDDQNYLDGIARGLAPILQQTWEQQSTQDKLEKTQQELENLQTLFESAQARNDSLQTELAAAPQEMPARKQNQKVELQNDHLKKAEDTMARLQVENRRLGEMVESLISDADTHELTTSGQLKRELHQSLEEIARLKNHILELEKSGLQQLATASELDEGQTTGMTAIQSEVFSSIAQDLRQPMSSIVGYTDLLLGESVGILGALQRKFLERIQASTERMMTLLDDLIRVTMLDGEQFQLNPETVDLGNAIDKAIADTSKQLREKNIILRVDLPDSLPHIHADRDALQQILIHLLKNAGSVSRAEGEIFLRAEIQASDRAQDFVLIQIADQGGGIPKEDLPRVFSRLYRADNPLIEGVGDTGVGLSIAKTLVEAHQGRIWVDTEMGAGSAFNVLLPLSNEHPHRKGFGE